MKVIKVHYKNICGVEEFSADFSKAGVVVFTGPNGSGKSTTLSFIRWQLTQETPTAHKTKNSFRRVFGDERPEPAGGIGTYEVNGIKFTIESWLHENKWVLTTESGEVVHTVTKIKEYLETVIGLDIQNLSRYGFIEQGQMRNLLFSTPSDRMAALQELVKANIAEEARNYLRGVANNINVPDYGESITSAQVRVGEAEEYYQELKRYYAEKKQLRNGLDFEEAKKVISNRKLYEVFLEKKKNAENDLKELLVEYKEREKTLKVLKEKHQQVKKYVDDNLKNYKGVLEIIEREEQDKKTAKLQEDLLDQKHVIETTLTAIGEIKPVPALVVGLPEKPKAPDKYEEILDTAKKVHGEIKELQDIVDAASTKAKSVSLALNVVVHVDKGFFLNEKKYDSVEELATAASTQITELATGFLGGVIDTTEYEKTLAAKKTVYAKLLKVIQNTQKAEDKWEETCRKLTEKAEQEHKKEVEARNKLVLQVEREKIKLDEINKKLSEIVFVCKHPPSDTERFLLQDYEKNQAELKELESGLKTQLAVFDTVVKSRKKLEETVAEEGPAKVSDREVEKAEKVIQLVVELESALQETEKHGKQQKERLESAKQELKELEDKQASSGKVKKFKKVVEEMREVLHRDRLPKRLVLGYMSVLAARCNEILPSFGADYLIEVDEDFCVRKSDGTKINASDLSGGEACRWTISFILAVHQLFARDLGLIVMDEPTDGLDKDGVKTLAEYLSKLNEFLSAEETQVLLATHEEDLAAGADMKITLKKG